MANAKVINRMVNLTSFVETAKVPTADDIMTGKEAWANGVKVVGEGTGASSGGTGWQPDPLWTNIRALWDEDTLRKKVASGVTFYSDTALTTSVGTLASSHPVTSVKATYGTIVGDGTDGTAGTTYYVAIADVTGTYIYSAIYLIAASDLTTKFLSDARYITSDGYDSGTVLARNYTHTWDLDDDMIDSTGAYTRWIKVYRTSAFNTPYNFNKTPIWFVYNLGTRVFGTSSSSTAEYYFNDMKSLQCVEIESNIIELNDYAFYNCNQLEKVSMTNNVTVLSESCFASCYGLKSVYLPNTITIIGSNVFYSCYGLKSVYLPNTITSIGSNFFYSCYGLKSVYLPNTITSIGVYSFAQCYGLTSFILENGFNCNGLDIHYSDNLSIQVVVAMLTALFDRTSLTAYTITIPSKFKTILTTAQKAIASNKNWTIAYA